MPLKQRFGQRQALKQKQALGQKIAQLFESPDEEFGRLVRRLEGERVFQLLANSGAVRRRPPPGVRTVFSASNEWLVQNFPAPASGELPALAPDLVAQIRKIGEDAFVRWFLAPREAFTLDRACAETGLSKDVARRIVGMLNTLPSVSAPAARPARPATDRPVRVIAGVTIEDGSPVITDFMLDMARGTFRIDDEKVSLLRESLPPNERGGVDRVVSGLRQVNARRSTIYEVVRLVVGKQIKFILSGNPVDRVPLTGQAAARVAGVHSSVISRVLNGNPKLKSIFS